MSTNQLLLSQLRGSLALLSKEPEEPSKYEELIAIASDLEAKARWLRCIAKELKQQGCTTDGRSVRS